jgi:hypothetical protein
MLLHEGYEVEHRSSSAAVRRRLKVWCEGLELSQKQTKKLKDGWQLKILTRV